MHHLEYMASSVTGVEEETVGGGGKSQAHLFCPEVIISYFPQPIGQK